ncbi:MAG: tetratricopeptide repeat protein [Lewinellaceae bacterium]|nr:tetratricopeptide repeat protein [Lewinellaceae bacterium]
MKSTILLLYCGCLSVVLSAQVNADSLFKIWNDPAQADTIRLQAIHALARSLMHQDPDSTCTLGEQELALAQKIKSKKWEGRALNVIGLTWRYRSDFAKALHYYEQSIVLLEQVGDWSFLSAVYGNMSDVYRVQSDYPKAIDCINKSLKMAEDLGDQKRIADAYISMSIMYYDTHKSNDKTESYLLKAQAIYEALGNQEGMSLVYGNLSTIYLDGGDYDKALLFNEKCMAIQARRGDLLGTATSLHNRATIFGIQGRHQEALSDFDREIDIFKEIGEQDGVADALTSKGELWIKLQRYPEAIRSCSDALQIAKSIGSPTLREVDACKCLYVAYQKQGNPAKALQYLELYMATKDSIQINETAQTLKQMELERQSVADSLRREKEKFSIEMEHQKTLRSKDKALSILLAAGLGGGLVAWAFGMRMLYFRRRSHNMQARSEALEKQQLLNEIDLLKTQVNPHFLFNSLSILSSLVHVNADLSEQFIEQLARSYRYILEQKDQPLVTLRTELEFIRSYAFLLKIRFENKFDLRVNLQEETLDKYKIAPLTLQLLVENAVKHNRMSVQEPLVLEVYIENDFLIVKNPLRLRPQQAASTGTGLNNIINRYALLTDRQVWAGECEETFIVKVPLLY